MLVNATKVCFSERIRTWWKVIPAVLADMFSSVIQFRFASFKILLSTAYLLQTGCVIWGRSVWLQRGRVVKWVRVQ